jgi:citrate lyase subunit beta/citryl-CoA lyase
MSHTLHPMRRPRLQRSELAVPGSNTSFIDKAADSAADFVFLDLEDAVAPADKEQARRNVVEALRDIDWAAKGKTVSVRINGLDTHYMYRDVIDVMEQAGDRVHTILVPKVGVPADLYCVETLINQLEQAKGYPNKVGIEALIETALGMANVEAIAGSPGRLEALHFGVADYAASNRARTVSIGGLNPDYPGDQWHFALSRMIVACRAYGLRPIDGPYGDFSDPAPGGPPRWALRVNGRFIPARLRWRMRCSARRQPKSTEPNGSSKRSGRPRRRARAPLRWTAR